MVKFSHSGSSVAYCHSVACDIILKNPKGSSDRSRSSVTQVTHWEHPGPCSRIGISMLMKGRGRVGSTQITSSVSHATARCAPALSRDRDICAF